MENTAMCSHLSHEEEDCGKEESSHILELRAEKESTLSRFSPKVRKSVSLIIDELLCETLFNIHKELKLRVLDPRRFDSNYRSRTHTPTLVHIAEHLNITKPTQEVDCPKCFVSVKCLLLSKHLALCMNPHQSTYSYSSRNSSRIARQRIQEGFKTTYDESKNDNDDEQVKPKKRSNKGKKSTIKNLRHLSKRFHNVILNLLIIGHTWLTQLPIETRRTRSVLNLLEGLTVKCVLLYKVMQLLKKSQIYLNT